MIFPITSAYIPSFFTSSLGITLMVFTVLFIPALIITIFAILKKNIKEDAVNNPVITIETDGDIPPYEHLDLSHIPDRREVDENAAIDNSISEIEENLNAVPSEDEAAPAEASEVREAVDETLQELANEEDDILPDDEGEADEAIIMEEEEENPGDRLAEDIAEKLEDKVDAEKEQEPTADSDELKKAVAEAMEDAVTLEIEDEEEPEPAEEVTEETVEETAGEAPETSGESVPAEEEDEEENKADEEYEDSSVEVMANEPGLGGGKAIDFIDVKENPEEYQFRLDRANRGEIELVSRYRVSFQAKLAQSEGNIQEYYSALKNALLGFKGVKCRSSWKYEAFHKGRDAVAKIILKTRSLYLYLAMDPATLAETKYNIVDVSGKKKFAATPVLLKIRGERKFKHALELVTMLCGDQMQLPYIEAAPVDYKLQAMTQEELIEAGLIKHMVGYIVLPTAPAEDAVAVSADVTEEPVTAEAEQTETPNRTGKEEYPSRGV